MSFTDLLANFSVSELSEAAPMVPRGMSNLGNTCFLSSVVQAIVGCDVAVAAFELLRPDPLLSGRDQYPVTRAISEIIASYRLGKGIMGGRLLEPLDAASLYDTIVGLHSTFRESRKYSQQDAEELLSFLLSAAHEELCKGSHRGKCVSYTTSGIPTTEQSTDDNDCWEEVGENNRKSR